MNKNIQDTNLLKAQNKILEMIATGKQLANILEEITKEIEDIIPNTYCSILLFNQEENTLDNGIGPSLNDAYIKALNGTKIGLNVGSCGTAAFRKELVITKDIEADIAWRDFRSLALSFGLRSCWSQPVLSSNEEVLGTFGLYYCEPREPNTNELRLLETFTHLTSVAIEHRKTHDRLSQNEKHYRLLAENVSDFVGILDRNGIYEYISSSHEKYLGYSSSDLLGKGWPDYVHPEDFHMVKQVFQKLVKTNKAQRVTFRFKHQQGHWVYLEAKGAPIREESGDLNRYVYVARDVTEQKWAEQQLRKVLRVLEQTKQKFESLYNNSLDAIFEIDSEGNYYNANKVAETLTGYKKEYLLTIGFKDLIVPNELEKAVETFIRVKQGEALRVELTILHKEGHEIIIDVNAVPVYKDNGNLSVIAFVQDITAKRHAEEEVKDLAYKDILTGLPNRYLFSIKLEEAIKRSKANKRPLGVLFIDFDNFKAVNDTLGHDTGDLLLQQVVAIIQDCLRKQDLISRQGGDEFLILIEEADEEELCRISERIIKALNTPLQLRGNEVFITPSIGISMFSDFGLDAEDLIKHADLAMYSAKEMGKNGYQFYSEQLNDETIRKHQLEDALRKAIVQNEFSLHYQPKFDLVTKELEGIEALLRWNPEFGFVSPAEFIPIAEETGLINEIGEWVLNEACRQNKYWYDLGVIKVPVAVNVSARQFKDPHFVNVVVKALRETKLPPNLLEFEITERVMIDVEEAVDTINQLRDMGIRIAIDDFGVGYSSLNMIKDIDIDNLKIDQSFLHDVMRNKKSAELLETIIEMGRKIGSSVVVEGIETKEQEEFLISKGVIGQGYYYSPPLPVDKLEKCLESLTFKQV